MRGAHPGSTVFAMLHPMSRGPIRKPILTQPFAGVTNFIPMVCEARMPLPRMTLPEAEPQPWASGPDIRRERQSRLGQSFSLPPHGRTDCGRSSISLLAAAMPAPLVQIIRPERHSDDRGWFAETYNSQRLADLGIEVEFVQDNHSLSRDAFTLRGLHFQRPPQAQAKLVRCVRGRIFDVVVDIRAGSPTYGNWVGATLSAEGGEQLMVPTGFAHGFLTLEPDCEVIYKCSDFYARESDAGLRWNDPEIAIDWPLPSHEKVILSDKDHKQPFLAEFESPFPYDGRPLAPLM